MSGNKCRICSESGSAMHLFDPRHAHYLRQIRSVTGVEFVRSPHDSEWMCQSCINRLDTAIDFRRRCILSEKNSLARMARSADADAVSASASGPPAGSRGEFVYHSEGGAIRLSLPRLGGRRQQRNEERQRKSEERQQQRKKEELQRQLESEERERQREELQRQRQLDRQLVLEKTPEREIGTDENGDPEWLPKGWRLAEKPQRESEERERQRQRDRDLPWVLENTPEVEIEIDENGDPELLSKESLILPFLCRHCSRRFPDLQAMSDHRLIHRPEGGGSATYICSLPGCGSPFKRQYALDNHNRMHTDERPFACSFCPSKFTQKSNRDRHMRSMHKELLDKELSPQPEGSERPLRRRRDPGKQAEEVPCEECGAKFSNISNFRKHKRLHTGQKPYECHICSKRFSAAENRDVHLFVHSVRKAYECAVCSKGFMRRNLLITHIEASGHENGPIVRQKPLFSAALSKMPPPSAKLINSPLRQNLRVSTRLKELAEAQENEQADMEEEARAEMEALARAEAEAEAVSGAEADEEDFSEDELGLDLEAEESKMELELELELEEIPEDELAVASDAGDYERDFGQEGNFETLLFVGTDTDEMMEEEDAI